MRGTLRIQILQHLEQNGNICSIFRFLCDEGSYDYSYGLKIFRQLEREKRIRMERSELRGHPWNITPGPNFHKPTPTPTDQGRLI